MFKELQVGMVHTQTERHTSPTSQMEPQFRVGHGIHQVGQSPRTPLQAVILGGAPWPSFSAAG